MNLLPPVTKENPRGKTDWRLVRNWLTALGVWISFAAAIYFVVQSLWNLIWAIPLYLFGVITLRVFGLVHPRAINPVPVCYVRWPMVPDSPQTNSCRFPRIDPSTIPEISVVHFPGRDGMMLGGQYLRGNRRAAVVLAHGAGVDGDNLLPQGIALHQRGYNVLLLDLRAYGRSQGNTSALGWVETNDLLDAVEYLRTRPEIDADKIGVFGFSMGGQVALRAAAQSQLITAVAVDDPSPASLDDYGGRAQKLHQWPRYIINLFTLKLISWMSGAQPPEGVLAATARIAPRPIFFIAAGKERPWVSRVFRAAGQPKDIWEIPAAFHGEGFRLYPEVYAEKLNTFFDTAFQ